MDAIAQKGNASLPKKGTTKDNTTKDNTKDTCRTFSKPLSESALELSGLLKKLIFGNKPDRKLGGSWDGKTQTAIDRMIRIDKRSPDQIRKIIEFSQADDFWWKNILSGDKLRKQYDRLEDELRSKSRRRAVGNEPPVKMPPNIQDIVAEWEMV